MRGDVFMSELLFFVLGLIIGGLVGITVMCLLQISKSADERLIVIPDSKVDGEACENEK